MNVDSALYVVVAIAFLWFGARMMAGKRVGGVSLGAMFKREKPLPKSGIGPSAIKTIIEDVKAFAHAERAVRGLILAGPFAEAAAGPDDIVTFVLLVDDMSDYREPLWRARWAYPARGHLVREHCVSEEAGAYLHSISLTGAPPLAFHFVMRDAAKAPPSTARALNTGAKPLETATDAARLALHRWQDDADDNKTNREDKT